MCGIGGGLSFRGEFVPERARLHEFARPLRFRGPDAEGHVSERFGDAALTLAHRRLTIIDLSDAANQPMASTSGHSRIVFNGEIYNYRELRRELEGYDFRFRTASDTEVLLNGYERWGIDGLLERIDGMYAFALYDIPAATLHLARDPFGKKPCYYLHDASRQALAFSSDIRSFKVLNVPLTLDPDALGYFFYELATPPERSIWREIRKVPGGSVLSFSRAGLTIRRHWQLRYSGDNAMDRPEIVESVDRHLHDAVRKRLVADVPVSALLSGGIDSSLVVAHMAQIASGPVSTYSVGFEDQRYNELSFARQVAERYATRHTEFVMQPNDVQLTGDLVAEYGEPFADSSAIPTYIIAKKLSTREKVVLGGDGGDELFAGYYPFYFVHKLDMVRRLAPLRPAAELLARAWPTYRSRFLADLLAAAQRPLHMLLDRNMGFARAEIAALFPDQPEIGNALDDEHARIWDEFCAEPPHLLLKVLAGSLHTRLESDYLVKVDRASMYASVEMRSPFLDKQLARFAATLPAQQLLKGGVLKSVLRDLAVKYLPAGLVQRPKMGFGVPVGEWFRGGLRAHFKDVVLGGKQSLVPIDYAAAESIASRHERGEDLTHRMWALYVFHLWAGGLASSAGSSGRAVAVSA